MAVRCVLVDAELDLGGLGDEVEVRPAASPLDLGPWGAREVLVVSADPDLLAAAGALGVHRLIATDPEATGAAVAELCRELDRS